VPEPREWWFGGAPDPGESAGAGPGVRPGSGGANSLTGAPQPELPSITLPKGGGAIRGLDERLTAGHATGTASLAVPIFTSPGRQGFGPQLSLSYDSASGNGPFGLGWSVPVAAVTRKTSKGLPRYAGSADSDVFLLSGDELVPSLVTGPDGWVRASSTRSIDGVDYVVDRYRPRVENAFALIERWRAIGSGDTHWRTISGDNVTSVFGRDAGSRIADPADPSRVFTWLLDLTYDDRGNAVRYVYKPEDAANVAPAAAEVGRERRANRYLKRILYGNETPYRPSLDAALPAQWCFEVVFDYGEHDLASPTPDETTEWPERPDPFSSYRSGFEVRCHRRCVRVLMFHHLRELGEEPALVRSTDLAYVAAPSDPALPAYSLLASVTQTGWVRASTGGGYETASLPPLDLGYRALSVDGTVRSARRGALDNVTGDLRSGRHRFVDLDGEGLAGILTEDDKAWYYKRNVSAWARESEAAMASFEPVVEVATKPALTRHDTTLQLTDLNGNGNLCAVSFAPPIAGYFERDEEVGWAPFRPLASAASIDWSSPELRFVDVDGDGLADVLVTEDDALGWHDWHPLDGFGERERVAKPYSEDRGPALVFADGTNSIFVADMSGDGLPDLVRVRSGEVCYWPNLGYGRFGSKLTMDSAPTFGGEGEFDGRRVHFADLDGSGTADLVYAGSEVTVWFNESGNGWTAPSVLSQCPAGDSTSEVTVFDLLGTGTGCVVWTSPLPADVGEPLRYVDITGGQKPYLLTSIVNNRGAATTIEYAPSTRFYLADRAAGTPWLTRLPFPVHVVARVETTEAIGGTRTVSLYSYRHGFYDGVEREFAGFARVERLDSDALPADSGIGTFTSTPPTDVGEFDLPPIRTISWFHTGAFLRRGDLRIKLALEWYGLDPQQPRLADTTLPTGTDPEALREACRSLRGRPLRVETYAVDGSPEAPHPYATNEYRYNVDQLQPPVNQSPGSCYTWERERLDCVYERNPSDPRVTHELTLAVDRFGAVTQRAEAAYPRRAPQYPAQDATLVRYVETDVATLTNELDVYRHGVPVETRSYELTGIPVDLVTRRFDPDALRGGAEGAATLSFETQSTPGIPQRRLLARGHTIYRSDDLQGALPPGQIEPLALVDATYRLVLTPGLVANVFGSRVATSDLNAAGLLDLEGDGSWWARTPRFFYSPDPTTPDPVFARDHFYLAQGQSDAWDNVTNIAYDDHNLLVRETRDAVGSTTVATHNYRVLAPWIVTDANENRHGLRYDALGMVVATAAMGKLLADGSDEGDHLDPAGTEPSPADDPTVRLEYDLNAYRLWAADPGHDPHRPQAISARSQVREQHRLPSTRWIESYVYSDGMGRVVLTKQRAEPGPAPQRNADGLLVHDGNGALVFVASETRWLGSGRVVYDNKGNPVKAYEPYFDSTAAYNDERELREWGVTAITRYDPIGRTVRVDLPNGTLRTVEFDAWRRVESDENDTVLASEWYAARSGGALGPLEADAAAKAAAHAGTSSSIDLDPLGRACRHVANNGSAGTYVTVQKLDIDGRTVGTTDTLGRVALQHDFDLTGAVIHSASLDSGERWLLHDAAGRTSRGWDSRGFAVRIIADALRRPVELHVTSGGAERLAEQLRYGEDAPAPEQANLRGAVYERRDGAGLATTHRRDYDGNVLQSTTAVLADYVADVDWSSAPSVDPPYTTEATYDAIGRTTSTTTPDGSITATTHNERGLLATISVALRGGAPQGYVTGIDYDAKGQRLRQTYGNGAVTRYEYQRETFRLVRLQTTRASEPQTLQDLHYTYDPVGNVTHIADAAQQTIFYANQVVTPDADYTYEPVYRLSLAKGREHISQTGIAHTEWNDDARVAVPLPSDGQAMRNYAEAYTYDPVGNLTRVAHSAAAGTWNRVYNYAEPNNRLTSTSVGASAESYSYDEHGNLISIPHLTLLKWDWKDELAATARQATTNGARETTYYRYDASGRRARKTTNDPAGNRVAERVYLGGYELYREYDTTGSVTLERQSLHVGDGMQRICLIETATVDVNATAPDAGTLVRYQLGNHLGSAVLELDANAAIISYEEYYPYGSTSFQSARTAAEVGLKRYRYIGKERDRESGFGYHGARYYLPWLGRWASCDPVESLNLYAYCRDSPVGFVDSDGREPETPQQSHVKPTVGAYRDVQGDHVHQVASRTDKPGAKRTSAAEYRSALSVSTSDPAYNDPKAQLFEKAFNRAMWGGDYAGTPADPQFGTGTVTLEATGDTTVGKFACANPSPWSEDVKSFYKLIEAGVDPNDASKLVLQSRSQLTEAGAVEKRVPGAPRSLPASTTSGQQLSLEERTTLSEPRKSIVPEEGHGGGSRVMGAVALLQMGTDAIQHFENGEVRAGMESLGQNAALYVLASEIPGFDIVLIAHAGYDDRVKAVANQSGTTAEKVLRSAGIPAPVSHLLGGRMASETATAGSLIEGGWNVGKEMFWSPFNRFSVARMALDLFD
jgi:RHS repeat-associated protein